MVISLKEINRRLHLSLDECQNRRRASAIGQEIARRTSAARGKPVVFFRASTGLLNMSLNTAFDLLASWGVRLAGAPVVHFTCQTGMTRCVQGTTRDEPQKAPPCQGCISHSRALYNGSDVAGFSYHKDEKLASALDGLSLDALSQFEYVGLPLGEIVLPSLRWIMRRHHLEGDENARFFLKEYILSARSVYQEFERLVEKQKPQAVVAFNGILYPEAIVRRVARQHGIRSFSYEVGFRPFSAFFTEGEATAYPIDLPADFELTPEQNARLDAYLEQRFKGDFTMAGVRFWPEMQGLDAGLLQKMQGFRQVVPVFTNVIFDTSQIHANTIFPHMFAWLDRVLELIYRHPETLFVIRAHPDEHRTNKESRESVQGWVAQNHLMDCPNVVFIESGERLSSYELIQRSKFVMVYNSSIGLEAALMGAPVLSAGRARYTQVPIVYFPQSEAAYLQQAEAFLQADNLTVPPEYRQNARKFLYMHLYRASLPFEAYLEAQDRPGFVRLKEFSVEDLSSPVIQVIADGILQGKPFLLAEE